MSYHDPALHREEFDHAGAPFVGFPRGKRNRERKKCARGPDNAAGRRVTARTSASLPMIPRRDPASGSESPSKGALQRPGSGARMATRLERLECGCGDRDDREAGKEISHRPVAVRESAALDKGV